MPHNAEMFKEARKWVSKYAEFEIGWIDENGAYNYIFREVNTYSNVPAVYKIVRVFYGGKQLLASVDATNLTTHGVFEFLINNIDKRAEVMGA